MDSETMDEGTMDAGAMGEGRWVRDDGWRVDGGVQSLIQQFIFF